MSLPTVSVVIVARNEARNIENCLRGIFRQTGGWSPEVIVIDSESEDGTADLARQHPVTVHSIPRREFHHGRTRNLGAAQTSGELIVFLQGDAWPADDCWLNELTAPMNRAQAVAGVYGRQVPKTGCDPVNRFRLEWNYPAEPVEKNRASAALSPHRLYFFSTANCCVRRRVWEQWPFPEDVPIFEDITFARRVIEAGYTIVYNPAAAVVHSHNLGAGQIFKRYRDAGYIYRQHGFGAQRKMNYRSEGTRYVFTGVRHIYRRSGTRWAARFLVHAASGYLGLLYGRALHRLGGRVDRTPFASSTAASR